MTNDFPRSLPWPLGEILGLGPPEEHIARGIAAIKLAWKKTAKSISLSLRSFFIALHSCSVSSKVASSVRRPLMTSTRGITGTGFLTESSGNVRIKLVKMLNSTTSSTSLCQRKSREVKTLGVRHEVHAWVDLIQAGASRNHSKLKRTISWCTQLLSNSAQVANHSLRPPAKTCFTGVTVVTYQILLTFCHSRNICVPGHFGRQLGDGNGGGVCNQDRVFWKASSLEGVIAGLLHLQVLAHGLSKVVKVVNCFGIDLPIGSKHVKTLAHW